MTPALEVNFDGLVGPTHNYAGLAVGNLASMANRGRKSSPRNAALQGLDKMRLVMELGVPQAVLPPHERPDLQFLRAMGFCGSDKAILASAAHDSPLLLANCYSSSAMWAANAATVTPSADAADGKVHFTPANLLSELHRSMEPPFTTRILRKIFHEAKHFIVHDPLPAAWALRDEGAANHLRLTPSHGRAGVEIFTFDSGVPYLPLEQPHHFPARQSLGASLAVRRRHKLNVDRSIAVQRSRPCIDAGAFHADLVALGNQDVLIYHQQAFERNAFRPIRLAYHRQFGAYPRLVEIAEDDLSLAEAVKTYFFNSQLVTLPDGSMVLIAPEECRTFPAAKALMDRLMGQGLFKRVEFVDVRQSMSNGGGPACLRLRVVLTPTELASIQQSVLLTPKLHRQLVAWVKKHYRDSLVPADLADPSLMRESRSALDELTKLLQLGPIYNFQLQA